MKNGLFALAAVSTLASGTLSARELLCEQCVPEPECWEHLFVERCQWFVHGEFLYWGVAEGNMDYAITFEQGTSLNAPVIPLEYKTADYDFCPGFRVAASYYNCPKYWEVTAQYTWMHNDGKERTSAPDTAFLAPTRIDTFTFTSTANSASSKVELDYQLGDLYVARVFDPNNHLRMRLYGGITLGYLKQEFEADYQISESSQNTSEEQWRFFGGGFRVGLTADWYWFCQIYLTGRVSFASLYGGYKNELLEQSLDGDDISTNFNTKYDDPRFAFHTQFMMGPSWQVPCDCWSFELFAGYEMNLWFNLNEGIYFSNTFPARTQYYQSVLGLHGLTLRLTFGW